MTHAIALADCPADIRAHFLADPSYQAAVQITKSESTGAPGPTHVTKTLKTGAQQMKKAVRPTFGEVLRNSMARNAGSAPLPIATAPAPTTAPTDEILSRATAPTRQAHNTPKAPATAWPAERGNPVEWRDLQQAIDLAMSKRQDEEKAEAFNRSRSAFSRITPTRKSDVQGGGSGDAWSLRNFGGKLAASVLNATTHKGDTALPDNSAWRPMTGRTLKP